jgi:hypothetical protein
MIHTSCTTCGLKGTYLDLDDEKDLKRVKEVETLLVMVNGLYYDFICAHAADGYCIACGQQAILYEDKRCNGPLWICAECINQRCVHRGSCYKDGCMSLEEFAEECQIVNELEADEQENWKCGE